MKKVINLVFLMASVYSCYGAANFESDNENWKMIGEDCYIYEPAKTVNNKKRRSTTEAEQIYKDHVEQEKIIVPESLRAYSPFLRVRISSSFKFTSPYIPVEPKFYKDEEYIIRVPMPESLSDVSRPESQNRSETQKIETKTITQLPQRESIGKLRMKFFCDVSYEAGDYLAVIALMKLRNSK